MPAIDAVTASWIRGPNDEAAVSQGCYFDLSAARRVADFFETFLRHSKAPWEGQPFALLEWQFTELIGPLFGWKRADGSRRYRRGYIEIPKKNGKSTLFSGLSLYLLMADGEHGAEVYSAAKDRDQAGVVFNEAANMAEDSPELVKRLAIVRSTKRIVFHRTRSVYRALSADVRKQEGLNASAVLFDELHAQTSRDMWDTLRYAGAARRQPLLLSITTAGYDRNSLCWEQHEYARNVIEGGTDPWFFGYIAAAEDGDDWTDPTTWEKANPSYGITIDAGQFAEDCQEAQQSPAKENSFRRYRLNQWTEQDVRWLDMKKWDRCAAELPDLDGCDCFAGLDLSSTTDLSALVLVFPIDDLFYVRPFFWVPEEGARERARRDKFDYQLWIKAGLIDTVPGEVIDYERIRRKIGELHERYYIREIAIDRWNATQLSTQLDEDGFVVVPFGQGFASMSAPTKALEEKMLSRKLIHDGNAVLSWMARNVSIEQDAADNWKPSKKKSVERIDGIVATIMGLDRAMRNAGGTAYDGTGDKGVILL